MEKRSSPLGEKSFSGAKRLIPAGKSLFRRPERGYSRPSDAVPRVSGVRRCAPEKALRTKAAKAMNRASFPRKV
ncbi:MAG: hypothetical protein LBR86_00495 [Tannerella sp.]|nr:hypothetical protein [Tannerella sp.]